MAPVKHIGCSVEGCDRKHYGRTYCNMHWQRLVDKGRRPRKPPTEQARKKQKARQRLKLTGWTPEMFAAAMSRQGGVCLMCAQPFDTSRRGKAVADHDHDTGAPRGLLHAICNLYVGVYEKQKNAIEAYLVRYGKE